MQPPHAATSVLYEPAGDTLRIRSSEVRSPAPAMRDVSLALDAAGHLVAVRFEDGPARPPIAVGPPSAVASWVGARVLAMESGELLITMAAKRVRGHERNPYVPWGVYPGPPT
ncbi:hypothetical protein OV203_10890 [Nannocystis sp. ILAH1]|uniref:hypothetical protein n=1 Tax=unclassified Nannocystis TaxID=2627009 RepID=UPI00226FAA94|nr:MULTISPECIES: hypothetical protein [unclassified Nannocystis]MCY0987633.1 hypothetical protein [Nannocystis sp. ILAH1]MCY1070565.1 hypothetical protein [Nannocystis sp. RBIL2]